MPTSEKQPPRAAAVDEAVARRVDQLRRAAGQSYRALADRCVEAGAPQLTYAVLHNVVTGNRHRCVTAGELVVLAGVFEVSPTWLLLGDQPAGLDRIEVVTAVQAVLNTFTKEG